ncbi:unnamed protein product [Pleuronectes platessa]|uniref:Uncharacterized protein n=1 Tax=Pleuronectes platessa TaxID=8262 RepID=A0A9N7VTQ6_PLEPL|nr:unnamed protein product [Pleuronectes platessa]
MLEKALFVTKLFLDGWEKLLSEDVLSDCVCHCGRGGHLQAAFVSPEEPERSAQSDESRVEQDAENKKWTLMENNPPRLAVCVRPVIGTPQRT